MLATTQLMSLKYIVLIHSFTEKKAESSFFCCKYKNQ